MSGAIPEHEEVRSRVAERVREGRSSLHLYPGIPASAPPLVAPPAAPQALKAEGVMVLLAEQTLPLVDGVSDRAAEIRTGQVAWKE